ncbi:TonB-dependent receptor plug domain-containing protein [Olleya sp. HaHaR_3_96]|uniref:TonB-dependent receptor plug domain-containing protein n=1 Tax=Olleya sp. HaHaR_3_96 TaxID=2745560 RepID=UPI001C4F421E|nr:TonB-dependent receptor [Olleya sp. HaHaR_3_96]QXP59537.1 TonB-dependent receptor [Olleya sp. HaHaR_3_96]
MNRFVSIFVVLCSCAVFAQDGPITKLDEVSLKYIKLKDSVYTTTQTVLNDSVLKRNQSSLTSLLNFNSTIYLKENGLGMVSSPSFRGTTAQQTAVLWNGININSQTTGQTDFNSINTRGFDQVVVKSGGGSVVDGSNAIGGSIYLGNNLSYNEGFKNDVFLKYGSFNTYGLDYKTTYSTKKESFSLGLSRTGSDNDYEYPGTDRINVNGQFNNTNISSTFGFKLDDKNTINVYSNIYDGKRHFSLPTPNALKTKYYDFNTRNMLEWELKSNNIVSNTKVAYLTENYEFYPNIDRDYNTYGKVGSVFVKYNLDYTLGRILLSGGLNYNQNNGEGSDIQHKIRHLGSVVLGVKQKVNKRFLYEVSLRQEVNNIYESPFLYSAGVQAEITSFYSLKLNTSKNFRIPTYNDLYWEGLGNPDLKPELSYQGEISNVLHLPNASLTLTGYFNTVENLLLWTPDINGIWRPGNAENVNIYGFEALFNANKKIGLHKVDISATYAYTVSKNEETDKQLIYVPYHKLTTSIGYNYKKLSAYYQFINNGEVFTTTDNAPEHIVNSYMLANLGLEYNLGKGTNKYTIGVQVLNLWNETYESVLNRPAPGRNYSVYLNLNI